jgi:hypothetical protein
MSDQPIAGPDEQITAGLGQPTTMGGGEPTMTSPIEEGAFGATTERLRSEMEVTPRLRDGRAPEWLRQQIRRIEHDTRLDDAVARMRRLTEPLAQGDARRALGGEWLGHALHPLMTDLPLGMWLSAGVLDFLAPVKGRVAARRLVGLGVLAALPTAVTGASDWAAVKGDDRVARVGVVHAVGNTGALACYAMSW